MSYYAIRLKPEQSLRLYGFSSPKKTLTWTDVIMHKNMSFKTLIENQIEVKKLYSMQSDIKEWIKHEKVFIQDFPQLDLWTPHPFNDFKCSLGDLVIYRQHITPQVLMNCRIFFDSLTDKYGLSGDIMTLLRYSIEDWIKLGISSTFINSLSDMYYMQIFGSFPKHQMLDLIKKHNAASI